MSVQNPSFQDASSAFTIRKATADDDLAVGELLVQSFLEQYRKKLPEVILSEKRLQTLRDVAQKRTVAHVWVAERNAQVVGTVSLWLAGAAGSEAFVVGASDLRHLAVRADARGGEVSKALLDAAEEFARQSGAPSVCLHVRRESLGVRRLYEARGYQRHEAGDIDALPDVFLQAFVFAFS
jgi:ribosomal protein S18 acetylase RimI-like enzyme